MVNIIFDEKIDNIKELLKRVSEYFKISKIWYGHGANNSWDEALHLVLPLLNLPINVSKLTVSNTKLTLKDKNHVLRLVNRRIKERIPVSYLTNKSWFCGHEFYVDERVLIPRSPISELINNRFSGLINKDPKHILDICTGSGCIAISCAYAFPNTKIDATDISMDALDVAKYNVKKHKLIKQVKLIYSDLLSKIPKKEKYDIIVTNPPYASLEDISNMPKEYSYEPKLGFISGIDGLQLIRNIILNSFDYLKDGGILICEAGNSLFHLVNQYPKIPFILLELVNGGNVFMLTKNQLFNARYYINNI